MDTSAIRTTINAIRAEASKSSLKSLKTKYHSFYENNPRLFEAAANVSFPLTYLDTMLAEIDKLNEQSIDMETADKNIYGQLRSIYVDPLIITDPNVITDDSVVVEAPKAVNGVEAVEAPKGAEEPSEPV